MNSLEVDGFYTLCLRDAIRPVHANVPSLSRAAADLVRVARARGIEQHAVLAELEAASRSVEWVTPYVEEIYTRAFLLGRAAIEAAYGMPAEMHMESGRRDSPGERPRSY